MLKKLITWHKLLGWKNKLGGYKPRETTKLINLTICPLLNIKMTFRESKYKTRRSINHRPFSNQSNSSLHPSWKDRRMLQLETETRFMPKEHFSNPVVHPSSNSQTSSKKKIRAYSPKYGLLSLKRNTNCIKPKVWKQYSLIGRFLVPSRKLRIKTQTLKRPNLPHYFQRINLLTIRIKAALICLTSILSRRQHRSNL